MYRSIFRINLVGGNKMIFELASTWKEGLALLILGTLVIFVGGFLRYKREQRERKESTKGIKLPNGKIWYPDKKQPEWVQEK